MPYKLVDAIADTDPIEFQSARSLVDYISNVFGISPMTVAESADDPLFIPYEISYSSHNYDAQAQVSLSEICQAISSSHAELELRARLEARLSPKEFKNNV